MSEEKVELKIRVTKKFMEQTKKAMEDVEEQTELRFDGIGLNKDAPISSATLTIIFNSHSTTDTDLKMITYGIDEDDTHDFDSGESNPLSRTKTSASTTSQFNDKNTRVDIDVKSIVEEITTRSGWSSGNAIGFTMLNNGSPTDVWFDCYPSTISTMYLIIVGGESFDIYFKCIIFKDKIA